jgi:hypothetical protein
MLYSMLYLYWLCDVCLISIYMIDIFHTQLLSRQKMDLCVCVCARARVRARVCMNA